MTIHGQCNNIQRYSEGEVRENRTGSWNRSSAGMSVRLTCGRSWVRAPSVPRRESCRICGSFFLCLESYMKQFAMPTSPCAASRLANAQKNREHFCSRFNCGRWDLNPHGVPTTRSLVLLVCQFRHFRAFLIKLSRMQEMGLEPTLCCHNRHLKPARLPFRHSCEQMLLY